MNKPISLIIKELKENLAAAINDSGLHPSIIEPILLNIYNEVNNASKLQLEKEMKEYENSLSEEPEPTE